MKKDQFIKEVICTYPLEEEVILPLKEEKPEPELRCVWVKQNGGARFVASWE